MSDLIDRQQAIDYFVTNVGFHDEDGYPIEDECELREIWTGYFDGIPSAQPEIIYCKDCVKHNKGLGNYEVHPDGSTTWIWKDSACPLVSWRDKAQGHEFDYQFCAYAKRREVTT